MRMIVEFTSNEDVAQVPGIGHGGGDDAVLGQRDHRTVVEHGQQHDQDGREVPAGVFHTKSETEIWKTLPDVPEGCIQEKVSSSAAIRSQQYEGLK